MKYFINVVFILFILFFTACSINYDHYYRELNKYSEKNQYNELLKFIEKNKKSIYSNKSLVLYYLDKAFFMHISENYSESNKYFTLAQKLYEENYTKSITKGSLSFFVNDKILVYRGEDFEFSMVFIFKALNYIMMDDLENALVEIRSGISFHKNLSNILSSNSAFKGNAFFDYISGILFEMNEEYNDAYISYKSALNLYNTLYFNYNFTQNLFNSTVDMAKKSMLEDKIEDLKKKYPNFYKNYEKSYLDEFIVLCYIGLVPYRISNNVEMSIFDAKKMLFFDLDHYKAITDEDNKAKDVIKILNTATSDYNINFSFPGYEKSVYKINSCKILFDEKTYKLEKVLDIGNIVLKNFDYKKTDIYLKEISRAILKNLIVNKINGTIEEKSSDKNLSSLFTTGVRILASITEDADRRSWRVLPDKILMTRIPILNKYNNSIKIEYFQDRTLVKDFSINEKDIKSNRTKKFFILRTVE